MVASEPVEPVAATGLGSRKAAELLERFGPNSLPEAGKTSLWQRFASQFRNPLIYILIFALAFDLGAWTLEGREGLPLEAIAIAIILLLNAALGMAQEYRAEAALEKLKDLAAPHVWAYRDGELKRLPSSELVPGDVVRLEAGDRVPADGMALQPQGLLLDESMLTGESVPIDKGAGAEVLAGTLVARGKTLVEITQTGSNSAMGRLAGMLEHVQTERTPLERRLAVFGSKVARWVIVLAAALVVLGVAIEGVDRFAEVFLFAVALAVAAVPEGLPAVLTSTLALGTERMARRRAVVRRLASVEALGSVTVIATDKTGTLTENRMRVRAVDTPDHTKALKAMVLASDAENHAQAGDPLELALLAYAENEGVGLEALRVAHPRHSSRPFDSEWRYMRITVEEGDRLTSYFKGAPEVLLERSTLPMQARSNWQEKITAYGHEGYRTLALAKGSGEVETELEFLGLALLWDPARSEVPAAVKAAQDAGIRVMMITGDHPATALAVSQSVGISSGSILTDTDLTSMEPVTLRRSLEDVNILARVSPEHKLKVVEELKRAGEIVAMTGDGVNDAPALKRSDVGVAMGRRGSDVAREVADLVLMDDNFATIVAAVEEGRSIYTNIQKFIRFLFATNLAEVLVVVLGVVAAFVFDLRQADGRFLLPLTATQILWINLVTDALPALALALDRNPAAMKRPPRPPDAALLDNTSLTYIFTSGSILALLVLGSFGALPRLGFSVDETRTAGFMILVLGQLLYTFSARKLDGIPPANTFLLLAVALCGGLQALMLLVPVLRPLLSLAPLTPPVVLWVMATTLLAWLVSEGCSALLRSRIAPAS
ncbi:MAG: cation-transporting P-type ATPase [Trueperaceae bacterium]|nr:MAG: cation-transporting P-type ATPase [Trueperaceae bacterium]